MAENQNPVTDTIGTVTGLIEKIVNTGVKVVDKGLEFFGLYTTQYSKYIVYGVLILAASKIFKIKLNIGK